MRISIAKSLLLLALPFASTLEADISEGRKLYQVNCSACHGKNLEGAVGFPLKDDLWVHGDSAEKIENSIRKGFSTKGMPGFGAMLKDEQITQIRDYILSEQQGLRELTVKRYAWNGKKLPNFDDLKVIQTIQLSKNKLDLTALKGMTKGALKFEGVLRISRPGKYKLRMAGDDGVRLLINDKEILVDDGLHAARSKTSSALELKDGAHKFELQYFDAGGHRALELDLIDEEKLKQPLFIAPVRKVVKRPPVLMKKEKTVRVSRHLLKGMSSRSLHVSFPSGLNLSIDPEKMKLAHFWQGDFLNLRAELSGRGLHPSLPLGKKLASPLQEFRTTENGPAKLKAFNIQGDKLTLEFNCAGKEFTMLLASKDGKTLQLAMESAHPLKLKVGANGQLSFKGKNLKPGEHIIKDTQAQFEITPGDKK